MQRRIIAVAAIAGHLLCAMPLLAAEGPDAAPQYELLTVDAMTAIWTIVVFVLLLLILRKFAWGPIQQVLVQREKFIADSLAHARQEREESQKLLKQYSEQIQAARNEATAIVEEGRRDAEVVKAKIQAEARREAEVLIDRAKREIGVARDTAVKDLYSRTASLATEVAGRIIRKELSPGEHERLIRESIDELAARGNGKS